MFKELQPLLSTRSLVLIIAKASDDQISVSLIPKSTKDDKDEDKALLVPLNITATAEELDNELADAITDFTSSYKTVAEQVAATKATMKATADAAAQAAKDKANSGKKTPASPAKKVEPAKPAEKKPDAAPSLFDAPAADETTTETEEEPEAVFEP